MKGRGDVSCKVVVTDGHGTLREGEKGVGRARTGLRYVLNEYEIPGRVTVEDVLRKRL